MTILQSRKFLFHPAIDRNVYVLVEGIQLEFLNVHELSPARFKRTNRTSAEPTDAEGSQMVPGVAPKVDPEKMCEMKK